MAQALYTKYRSKDFDELIGQEHVTTTLRNAMREERIAHAYLFTGPRGTGKTSMARIVAKALNCLAPLAERPCNECRRCVAVNEGRYVDLVEIDAASNNSVEDIRLLREKVSFAPSDGEVRVYIVDEVHMLSVSAFNALLKTLEEPPPHVRFILATTEIQKVPATVLSRCQRFDFRRIPTPEIAAHLRTIIDQEARQAEDEALTAIARSAQGCMRDAVSLLDQLMSQGEGITFQQVQEALGAVNALKVQAFVDAIATRDLPAGLALVQELLADGASLVEFCNQVVEHLRGVLMLQVTQNQTLLSDLAPDSVAAIQRQGQQLPMATTLFAIKRFGTAAKELRGGFQPQLPLEMALIESVQGVAAPPLMAAAPVQNALPQVAPVQPAQSDSQPAAPQTPQPTATDAGRNAADESTPAAPVADKVSAPPPPIDEKALARLRGSGWTEFKNIIRREFGPETQAYLNSVRDVAVGGNQVAFAFGGGDFAREQVSRPDTLAQIAGALSHYLGASVVLECQPGDSARLAPGIQMQRAQEPGNGPDPLLEYAVSELNAEVRPPGRQ